MASQALFEGLVFDEYENRVETVVIGGEAQYVVDDSGFRRHIPAEDVDRQVLGYFMEQLEGHEDLAAAQMLRMMGKDDIMTKAAVDASLRNIDIEQILKQGMPLQARNMMGMMGFRVTINYHGEVIKLDQPSVPDEE